MKKARELVPVRLSHLLHHCSVGSIIRGPNDIMTVKDIRSWTDKNGNSAGRQIPYVERVRKALGIPQELRVPPIAVEMDKGFIDGVCIPVMQFPSWMRCPNPKCGHLYYRPWHSQNLNDPHCVKCDKHPALEQVTWILAHPESHMNDVPWHYLTHKDSRNAEQRQCKEDRKESYLQLKESRTTGKILSCTRCRANAEFNAGIKIPFGSNTPRQPWLKEPPDSTEGSALAEVLEINDVRVHSAITQNALVIPPESRIRKGAVVDRLYQSSSKRHQIEQAKTPLSRKAAFKRLAAEMRCTSEEIEQACNEINKGYPLYGKNISTGILFENEYQALLEDIPDISEDEDFVKYNVTSAWKSMSKDFPAESRIAEIISIVASLVSVSRLKEIQVLKGFKRLGGTITPPDIVGQSNWLPAIELYGEGIFFVLDENVLTSWEKSDTLTKRAKEIDLRYARSGMQLENEIKVSPRLLLLHTLSHLLIRQLEMEAGYPAASLKERIYCTSSVIPMAGILVYVAVPDVVGSLGGLVELAEPRRFLKLLSNVFDHAEWCSLDPVCSEHDGQGQNLLNRAACHACALIPEPSCSFDNVLLDRVFVRGDPAAKIPSILDFVKTGVL
jgi:hypothetical protein